MTASWADRPLLALDCESTGVNPFADRIVEVAAVVVNHDGSLDAPWSTVIDPGVPIPEGAADVHGISTERARVEGVEPAEAITHVAQRIWRHLDSHDGQAAVVAYNARFDWPLLLAEAERHGVEFPCFAPVLDPYLLDRMCDRYRRGKRQLTLVADHYDVPLSAEDAHGALADATAAGRVMRAILTRYPALTEHTLAGLWLHQAHGHEKDRQRLVDWKRRNSDPDFDIPAGWPIPVEVER
jgi:DNA polymerase-3 subunit epsilon